MKRVLPALVVAAGFSALLNAQTQDNPSKPAADSPSVTVTGCLQEEDSGTFSLTEEGTAPASKGKTFRLTAAGGVDLKSHVGHKVQLTGSKADKAGKEPTEKGVAEDPAMLKVSAVKPLSGSCSTVK
jgi:hypothetical protein